MAIQTKSKDVFDPTKLQQMSEPMNVRVVRINGTQEEPIFIPAQGPDGKEDHDGPPGANWSREAVGKLETWIANSWTGGGTYEAIVSDLNNQSMKWRFNYPVSDYPPRPAPVGRNRHLASVPPAQAAQPVLAPAPLPPAPPFGQSPGFPPQPQAAQQPQMQQPQAQPQPQPQQVANPFGPQPQQPNPWAAQNPWGVPQNPFGPQPFQPNGFGQNQFNPAMPFGWNPSMQQPQFGPGYFGPQGFVPAQGPFSPFSPQGWQQPAPAAAAPVVIAPLAPVRDLEAEKRAKDAEDKSRELEKQIVQSEKDRMAADFAAREERMRQETARQMAEVKEEVRRANESATAKKSEPDAATAKLLDEIARLKEQQQKDAYEATQRQVREAAEATQRQVADLAATIKSVADGKGSGSDAMQALDRKLEEQKRDHQRELEKRDQLLAEEKREREREKEAAREREARERETREAKEREDRIRQDMRDQAAKTEAMLREMKDNSTKDRGPDPMLELMKDQARQQAETQKETARQHAEAMKEIARSQQESANRMSSMMMNPLQMFQLIKDAGSNNDGFMKQAYDMMGGMLGMFRTAAENLTGLSGNNGPSSTTQDLVREGLSHAARIANQLVESNKEKEIAKSQTQVAQAQYGAQAQAAQAYQAQALAERERMMRGGQQPQPVPPQQMPPPQQQQQPQPAAVAGGGLSGPVAMPPEQEQAQVAEQPAAPQPNNVVEMKPKAQRPKDEELFGVALPDIEKLRKTVAAGNLTAAQTVDAILEGVEFLEKNKIPPPPAFLLFEEEMWADFVDALLPKAPDDFKTEVVRILSEELEEETEKKPRPPEPTTDAP